MDTHNLVTRITSGVFLEFIAIDPETAAPNGTRWFVLDYLTREGILKQAPWLFGQVASVPDLVRNVSESSQYKPLEVMHGDLRWHSLQYSDGETEAGGCWPALIDWVGGQSPVGRIQEIGLRPNQFQFAHPEMPTIRAKFQRLGWDASKPGDRCVGLSEATRPTLMPVLDTPSGLVQIGGGGL